MKTDFEVIKEARDLIAKGWTKYSYARAEDGVPTTLFGVDACKFCAVGAIARVVGPNTLNGFPQGEADRLSQIILDANPYLQRVFRLEEEWGESALSEFNDNVATDNRDVLDVFDKAIATLEAKV